MHEQAAVHIFIVRNEHGVSGGKLRSRDIGIKENIALVYEQ